MVEFTSAPAFCKFPPFFQSWDCQSLGRGNVHPFWRLAHIFSNGLVVVQPPTRNKGCIFHICWMSLDAFRVVLGPQVWPHWKNSPLRGAEPPRATTGGVLRWKGGVGFFELKVFLERMTLKFKGGCSLQIPTKHTVFECIEFFKWMQEIEIQQNDILSFQNSHVVWKFLKEGGPSLGY